MKNAKNIQMPFSFVVDVLRLIFRLDEYDLDRETTNRCRSLESQIEAKLAAMNRREAFSKYKLAPLDSPERNSLRLQYLELTHIHKDWISTTECN